MTRVQKSAVAIAVLANFVAPFMTSALNLSINDISIYFNCGATTTTWIVNAYTLATAVFSIPLGHLADLKGRRKMIMVGSGCFCLFAVLCMVATSANMLIVLRLCMGISAGVFLGAGTPLMLGYFKPAQQGRYVGLAVAAISCGVAIGPAVGGIMNATFGWRSVFVPTVVMCVAIVVLCWRGVEPDVLPQDTPANDVLGNVLFVVSLGALMFSLAELRTHLWAPVLMVAGALLLVVFVRYEMRQAHPVVQVRLFAGNPVYGLANLATLLSFVATYTITYVMAIHLQNIYGFDSAAAGGVMMVQPVIQAVCAPMSGKLAERIESNGIAAAGMVITAVGLVALCQVSTELPLGVVVAGLAVSGLGTAVFTSPNTNAILSCVRPEHKSEANATVSAMRGIGQSVALAAISFIFSVTIGNTVFAQAEPAALAHSVAVIMTMSLVAAVVAALLCVAASLVTKRR